MGAASATPAGACLMPQVEAVPNAEAMDWSDYWMDAAAATEGNMAYTKFLFSWEGDHLEWIKLGAAVALC